MKYKEEFMLLLSELQNRYEKANAELAKCPPGGLVKERRGDKHIMLHTYWDGDKKIRRVITDKTDVVASLARKKYLEAEIKTLSGDMAALSRLINSYTGTRAEDIIDGLPEKYKALPEEYFFRPTEKASALSYRRRWAEAPYEQSTYKPEEKVQKTARGLKVRTKSEVIVAERLDEAGVPYRYEQMIHIDDYSFAPDFTILTEGGIIYWEHAGKMNDKGYLRKHKWKMEMYERAGIVPWKNLIVTYDDPKGGLDSRIIVSEIRNKLL